MAILLVSLEQIQKQIVSAKELINKELTSQRSQNEALLTVAGVMCGLCSIQMLLEHHVENMPVSLSAFIDTTELWLIWEMLNDALESLDQLKKSLKPTLITEIGAIQ